MTTLVAERFCLPLDQVLAAAARIGGEEFPAVLALRSEYLTVEAREAALSRGDCALVARQLMADGMVHPDLAAMLRTLRRPARELAMRLVTPDGLARFCIVRDGVRSVLVRRVGADFTFCSIGAHLEFGDVATALVSELPNARPADISPVSAPLQDVVQTLSGTHDPIALADRIRALGVESDSAMLLGTALGARHAFAEIVYYALAEAQDHIVRGSGAVGVFYTKRGRIVGAPSVSPSGETWSTLKSGTARAISQAIGQLIEISGHSWGHG